MKNLKLLTRKRFRLLALLLCMTASIPLLWADTYTVAGTSNGFLLNHNWDQTCSDNDMTNYSGTGYYYFIQAANKSNNITITLNNVNMTNNNLLFENEESSNQEVTVVLVGDNIMNNENANSVGIRLRHGKSTKFTGTGTLVIKNSDFDPAAYTNVTFDGLKATYDKDTNTTTIQPE